MQDAGRDPEVMEDAIKNTVECGDPEAASRLEQIEKMRQEDSVK